MSETVVCQALKKLIVDKYRLPLRKYTLLQKAITQNFGRFPRKDVQMVRQAFEDKLDHNQSVHTVHEALTEENFQQLKEAIVQFKKYQDYLYQNPEIRSENIFKTRQDEEKYLYTQLVNHVDQLRKELQIRQRNEQQSRYQEVLEQGKFIDQKEPESSLKRQDSFKSSTTSRANNPGYLKTTQAQRLKAKPKDEPKEPEPQKLQTSQKLSQFTPVEENKPEIKFDQDRIQKLQEKLNQMQNIEPNAIVNLQIPNQQDDIFSNTNVFEMDRFSVEIQNQPFKEPFPVEFKEEIKIVQIEPQKSVISQKIDPTAQIEVKAPTPVKVEAKVEDMPPIGEMTQMPEPEPEMKVEFPSVVEMEINMPPAEQEMPPPEILTEAPPEPKESKKKRKNKQEEVEMPPAIEMPPEMPMPEAPADALMDMPVDMPMDLPVEAPVEVPVEEKKPKKKSKKNAEQSETPIQDAPPMDMPADAPPADLPMDAPPADLPLDMPMDAPPMDMDAPPADMGDLPSLDMLGDMPTNNENSTQDDGSKKKRKKKQK
ncbi:autotransporter-associated_beta strand repeat-containing protein [Hexamita inflata]|uniref:Autotransporter-associated beta strand repeat-containing protein n=1 Tax=Hexamita inflata TaxID=28002 RepID=A0AA86V3Y3_9EUKA|nr:autotransporter-associated beta strand repeat-containing protein [Hexamita inflata]